MVWHFSVKKRKVLSKTYEPSTYVDFSNKKVYKYVYVNKM